MLERALLFETGAARRAVAPILPLEAQGLVFEAGGRRLIDGLDLELRPGMRTVVMGPNGAGKSLMLRLLHGLLQPSAGTVLWDGRPADDAIRRRQAMVFQRPVLLRRSALGNLQPCAASARRAAPRAAAARASRRSSRLGLAPIAHTPARAAVRRRAAAPGARPRAEPRARGAVPRRADRQPRSRPRRVAIERLIQGAHERRHQDRAGHPRCSARRAAWPTRSSSCTTAGSRSMPRPRASSTRRARPDARAFLEGRAVI